MSPTLLSLLLLTTSQVAPAAEDEIAPPIRPPIVKPVQPIGRPVVPVAKWSLSIQKDARFDEKSWGEASEPVSTRGLRLVVQPERKSFAGNGPLAFRVTLENVSENAIELAGGRLGAKPRLVLANQKTGAQWSLTAKASKTKGVKLAAGDSASYTLVVSAPQIVFPRPVPVPLPGPIPRPLPQPIPFKGVRFQACGAAGQAQPVPIRRPIRPPVFVGQVVPVGQGTVRAQLFVEFDKPAQDSKAWSGRLAAKPVEFEIGKPEPVVPPGVPTTKETAVKAAIPVAEAALRSNYRPVPGIRPEHSGTWIEDAEKTANVTQTKSGWTVSWTHTPRRGGFGYNVTVDVTRGGGGVVREVFTSYSPKR